MKKMILGVALFLGGIIGFSAWIIASMIIIQPGGVSSVASGLRAGSGIPIMLVFLVVAIAGLAVAVVEVGKE